MQHLLIRPSGTVFHSEKDLFKLADELHTFEPEGLGDDLSPWRFWKQASPPGDEVKQKRGIEKR